MIYRNDNIIETDDYISGTLKDLKEYFRYKIASLCISGEDEQDEFTNTVREICDLLDEFEELEDKCNKNDKLYVCRGVMGNFYIKSEVQIMNRLEIENYCLELEKDTLQHVQLEKETLLKYLIEEISYNYIDNLLNYDDYKDVKLLTIDDIVEIAENMCNLYYFNEGVNEIIFDNIYDYLYKDCAKEGAKNE